MCVCVSVKLLQGLSYILSFLDGLMKLYRTTYCSDDILSSPVPRAR